MSARPPRASRRCTSLAILAALLAACSSGSLAPPSVPGGGTCSLPAAASLSVVSVTPADDAVGVFVGASVVLRFNTCLDAATVTAANFALGSSGGPVPRSLSYDAATATVTMRPSASLAYGAAHIVAAYSVKGARGETMAAPFSSSFTTQFAPEGVAPTTTASPRGGTYHETQNVTLTCTDNAFGTGCAATYYTTNGATPTALSTRYTSPIAIATSTTLRFFSVDVQGNPETPKEEVYVIDKVPPTLQGSDPGDGASNVPLTKVVTATFSEAMDAATLTSATVTVDQGVTVTLSYDAGTHALAITPTERLACNTTHHVAIGAGATDLAGNALVQPATFAFTTHADCVEPATAASDPGGIYTSARSITLTCTDGGGSGCARIVYTTDGTVPSLDPPVNGTIVAGASAGPIAIGVGDTVLRYFAEDAAGNREVLREQLYSVSTTGFTFVGTDDGLARGVGPVPDRLVPILPGGRTQVFHRDGSNGRLYRGTQRGLLYSDGGEAWTEMGGNFGSFVTSVLARGSKVYVGTGGGLWVSTDGGGSFESRGLGGVTAIAASGHHVYVATFSGLAVSADKGRTFTMRTAADGLGSTEVRGLVLDGSTFYAATGNGVSISVDGAASFTNYTAGLSTSSLRSVRAIAVSGSTVYIGTEGGLCVSTDGGQSYTVKATSASVEAGQPLGSNWVGVLVLDGGKLYLGTGPYSGTARSLAISDNGGTSFTYPLVAPVSDTTLKVDTVFVEGTTVRVGAYPAYYLSTDGGSTFAPKDLRGAIVRITGAGTSLYMAISDGSGHGGVAVSRDGGRSFIISGREAGLAYNNVDDVFATGSNVYAATFSGVGFSADGGVSFVNHNTSTAANSSCVYASGTTVWVCGNGAIEKSVSGGAFEPVEIGTTSGGRAIAVSGSNFYVATTNGLLVSNTGGDGPYARRGATQGLGNTYLYGVAVDSAGTVLAVSNSSGGPTGFYLSYDAGASFSALPGPAMFADGIYAHGTTWYLSNWNGLRISVDGGTSWKVLGFADGLPGAANGAWYMP